MTTFRILALAVMGAILSIGCNDSPTVERHTTTDAPSKTTPVVGDTASDTSSEAPAKSPHGDKGDKAAEPAMPPGHEKFMKAGDQAAEVKVEPNNGELDLDGIHFTVPKDWIRKPPKMMIQAEYAIPKAEGDKNDGRVTFMMAGGGIDQNIDRWKRQFGGKPKTDDKDSFEVDGQKVTWVDLSGDYTEGMMMGGGGGTMSDYRMLAAIYSIDGKLLFVKCLGPEETMKTRVSEIKNFVKSMKMKK